jgi:hypothetical protein
MTNSPRSFGSRTRRVSRVNRPTVDIDAQTVVIERSLSALTIVVILDVENAEEFGVQLRYVAHGIGHELAESAVSGVIPDGVPSVLVRDEEPDDGLAVVLQSVFVVSLDDFTSNFLVAELNDLTGELVVEHVRQAFEEDKR